MKNIKISNDHSLHVYLIKHSHVSENIFEDMNEADSREMEEGFDPEEWWGDIRYQQAAESFLDAMEGRHCAHLLDIFTQVFAKALIEHWSEFGASSRLDEPQYKCFVDFMDARIKAKQDLEAVQNK